MSTMSPHRLGVIPLKIDKDCEAVYLKMLAICIGKLSRNIGVTRKDIWKFFIDNFVANDFQEYHNFLAVLQHFLTMGKLEKSDLGYYQVQCQVYQELYKNFMHQKDPIIAKLCGKSSVNKKRSAGKLQTPKQISKGCLSTNKKMQSVSVSNPKSSKQNSLQDINFQKKPNSSGKVYNHGLPSLT